MPDKDPNDGPSLELPSFGFGRKRKKKDAEPAPAPAPVTAPVPALAEPAPQVAPEAVTQKLDPIAPAPARVPEPAAAPVSDTQPRTTPMLGLGPLAASLLTGAVVGLLTALLAYGSQRLCEVVRSTSSCGGAGVLLLLAILVGMTLLGGALLRAFVVPEAGSTSVLAVGLLAVLVLLFLIDASFSPAIFVVLPVLAAGCYAAANFVTKASTSTD